MGSHNDSSPPAIRDSSSGGAPVHPLGTNEVAEVALTATYINGQENFYMPAFKSPEGCRRKDIKELRPAVADEDGSYQVFIAQEYPQRLPAPDQAPMQLNAIDARYAAEFERLVRALDANPQAVPPSVTGGSVAILSVVGVTSGGDTVFGSVLEEHEVTGQTK